MPTRLAGMRNARADLVGDSSKALKALLIVSAKHPIVGQYWKATFVADSLEYSRTPSCTASKEILF